MAATVNEAYRFNETVTFVGGLSFGTSAVTNMLAALQRSLQPFTVPFTDLRVWDAFATILPGTAASDDLALVGGTFGTGAPKISAGDLKTAGATTRRARFMVQLPPEYVAGQAVTLRLYAGMETTIADSTATLDVEAFLTNQEGVVSGSDLYTGAAVTINTTVFANKDFSLTATSLTPGAWIDVRVSIAVNDAATGTAVDAAIGLIQLLCTTQG